MGIDIRGNLFTVVFDILKQSEGIEGAGSGRLREQGGGY